MMDEEAIVNYYGPTATQNSTVQTAGGFAPFHNLKKTDKVFQTFTM